MDEIGAQSDSSGNAVQPDWNQNDPTAPDYVKNRPFYDEHAPVIIELPAEQFYEDSGEFSCYVEASTMGLPLNGSEIKVVIEGEEYFVPAETGHDWFYCEGTGEYSFTADGYIEDGTLFVGLWVKTLPTLPATISFTSTATNIIPMRYLPQVVELTRITDEVWEEEIYPPRIVIPTSDSKRYTNGLDINPTSVVYDAKYGLVLPHPVLNYEPISLDTKNKPLPSNVGETLDVSVTVDDFVERLDNCSPRKSGGVNELRLTIYLGIGIIYNVSLRIGGNDNDGYFYCGMFPDGESNIYTVTLRKTDAIYTGIVKRIL